MTAQSVFHISDEQQSSSRQSRQATQTGYDSMQKMRQNGQQREVENVAPMSNRNSRDSTSLSPNSSLDDDMALHFDFASATSSPSYTFNKIQNQGQLLEQRQQVQQSLSFTSAPSSNRSSTSSDRGGIHPAGRLPSTVTPGDVMFFREEMGGLAKNGGGRLDMPVLDADTSMLENVQSPRMKEESGQSDDGLGQLLQEAANDANSPPALSPATINSILSPQRYQLIISGIPEQDARSRVETQIRMDLQLVDGSTSEARPVSQYKWLKFHEYMVAKEKLLHRRMKEKPTIAKEETLEVDASVICSSSIHRRAYICSGCILRERKRMNRGPRDKKKNQDGGDTAGSGSDSTRKHNLLNPIPIKDEEKKILVINSAEYTDFSSGSTSIPFRITCYCRHHKENKGYRVVMSFKDAVTGKIVAAAISPNIYITDDHKGPNVRAQQSSSRDISFELHPPDSRTTSRRNSASSNGSTSTTISQRGRKRKQIEGKRPVATPAGLSTPPISKPNKFPSSLSMTKLEDDDEQQPPRSRQSSLQSPEHLSRTRSVDSFPALAAAAAPQLYHHHHHKHAYSRLRNTATMSAHVSPKLGPVMGTPLPNLSLSGLQSAPVTAPVSPSDIPFMTGFFPNSRTSSIGLQQDFEKLQMAKPSPGLDLYDFVDPSNMDTNTVAPVIKRLIPTEGPMRGGAEITILGDNFHSGLTCMFGDNAAIPSHCWNSTTMVCTLPPSITPGVVVVGFKKNDQMITVMEGSDIRTSLFTYIDDTERALMELALQVVGLKMTGRLEDARQIAMRIVGANDNSDAGLGTDLASAVSNFTDI